MLYKAKTSDDHPAMIEGQAHPEDTARAVDAIRNLICHEEGLDPALDPGLDPGLDSGLDSGLHPAPADAPAPQPAPRTRVAPLSEPASEAARSGSPKDPEPAHQAAQSEPAGGFQPSWKLSAGIFLAAIMLWHPWLVPSLMLLTLATAGILWFSIGPDRAGEAIAAWHARLARRNPDRAETMRRFAARWSERLERTASHLPERWTRGLYFPDFDLQVSEEPHNPFDRLAPQHRH